MYPGHKPGGSYSGMYLGTKSDGFGSYSGIYLGSKPGGLGNTLVGYRVTKLGGFGNTRVCTRVPQLVVESYSGMYPGTLRVFASTYLPCYISPPLLELSFCLTCVCVYQVCSVGGCVVIRTHDEPKNQVSSPCLHNHIWS